MRSGVDLQGGACQDLAPAVIDKYWFADGNRGRMRLAVGQAICAKCPIQLECLEEAIIAPPGHGMRGGMTNGALWRLHQRWMDEHVDADVLALHAMEARRASLAGVLRQPHYRRGNFVSAELAYPELGGAS